MADAVSILDGADAIGGGLAAGVSNFGQTLYTIIYILFGVLILGGLIWFVWWWSSFKQTVKIREIVSSDGHYLVLTDKAKRKKKDGAEFWKLRRRKSLLTAPPSDAIQITRKGRLYAECTHHEKSGLDAGYQWVIPDKKPESGAFKVSQTQEERALVADRMRRANQRKSMRTLDAIMQMAGLFFVVIILVVVLSFYGEISGNVSDASKEVESSMQRVQQITKSQAEFQKQLNEWAAQMKCEVPEAGPGEIPLDQKDG